MPFLLASALSRTPPGSEDPHDAGTAQLERIVRRGQRTGDFDRTFSAAWLTDAILGLARTAAEQVAAGRLTARKAATTLQASALRLCGAGEEPTA
ncbi:hypothetical protein KZZ52_43015 [Dactylosporangium sp. AC04546]|uniref:hypothetical protein n=1 Tax=Dactylosporangium sp. AC04546 TaxID=2862460 RepID=UPI001EDDF695|nr:hypothetical protein [Dactylosporangium sp. AC04546]WVK80685.1 hypothetical protein KZZ52_43015 [Dactylosporangium sp. AC04546]